MSNQTNNPTVNTAPTAAELMEKIKAASIARKEAVAGKIEVIKLANELQYIESPQYEADQVLEHDTAIVNHILEPLEGITDKKFTMYKEFNFSGNVNALIGAVKTITMQKAAGFAALNQAAVMSKPLADFIEVAEPIAGTLIEAWGRNTYFDKLSCSVNHGTAPDVKTAVAMLYKLARGLGMANLDVSRVTEEHFNKVEERARAKTEQAVIDNQLLDEAVDGEAQPTMDFKVK